MDELYKDQEEKFVKCISAAADEFINFLKKKNEELRTQNNQLRNEVASISSSWDEHSAEYQKLLMEENQKNRTLSEELERLRNLQQEGFCGSSKDNRNKNIQLNTPEGAQVESVNVSNDEARKTTRRPGRDSRVEVEGILTPPSTGQVRESVDMAEEEDELGEALVMEVIEIPHSDDSQFLSQTQMYSNGVAGDETETETVGGKKRKAAAQYNNRKSKRAVAAMLTPSKEGASPLDVNLTVEERAEQ